MSDVYSQTRAVVEALTALQRPDFRPIRLLVVGGSSSEVDGGVIGHQSHPENGVEMAKAVLDVANERGFDVAFQCCEHLNRALVVERDVAERYGYECVCAVPYPKAGGSLAAAAYRQLRDPVLVEHIQADAGMDIGQTLIGMHLKAVAVPVRLPITHIGAATVTCAGTRPRLIGGERARYTLESPSLTGNAPCPAEKE